MSDPSPTDPPSLRRARRPWSRLGAELEAFATTFPVAKRLASDPVHLIHRFAPGADLEVAAYLASMLAFGRVGSFIPKIATLFDALGPQPARRLLDAAPHRPELPGLPATWAHRWIRRDDLIWLLAALGRVLAEDGSLGAAALAGQEAAPQARDLLPAMAALVDRIRRAGADEGGAGLSLGRRHLVPAANGLGAAKRVCLLFRWLVRPADGVDLGTWSALGPERLTIPLDTHVARIGRYVGLTERTTPNWAMAREITQNLCRFAPEDPTRFDFALSHLGIMGACPRRRRLSTCAACQLVRVCRL